MASFDDQILIYKLKKYIVRNNITDPASFYIYINAHGDLESRRVVKEHTFAFKAFIAKYKHAPEKTKDGFEREMDHFIAQNSAGIERGMKLRELQN